MRKVTAATSVSSNHALRREGHARMFDHNAHLATIAELERRQEEMLDQLEDLEKRVEQVLAEWLGQRQPQPAEA